MMTLCLPSQGRRDLWLSQGVCHRCIVSTFMFVQWSFGVTCWEVFSLGRNPYPGVGPFSIIRYLERGERLDKPLNAACSQEMLLVP